MPRRRRDEVDVPSTIERSDEHARRIFTSTLQDAEERYGAGERARRTAFASLKHSYGKVGDHWEPKDHRGPSDEQAARSGRSARSGGDGATAGGVDANASKGHLMGVARRLDIRGRSRMGKDELVREIDRANRRETRRARKG